MSDIAANRAANWFTPRRFALLLALLVFASFPQVVLGLQTFIARDYGFFAYPLAHFQRDCFWRGQLPFWDPFNNCGIPFLAQWNTMPLYPPALIYLLLPLAWGLGFFCLLHFWFGGLGMYFLARKWTGDDFAAAFAGVAFTFSGLTLNLLTWPSHTATWSWMPWVVFAVENAWRDGGRKVFIAAVCGAFQMLAGGPEIIFFTWLLLLALWVQQFKKVEATPRRLPAPPEWLEESGICVATGASPPCARVEATPRRLNEQFKSSAKSGVSGGGGAAATDFPRKVFWRFPVIVALVAAMAAAQLLPFLDLAAHSQRQAGYADLRWAMPGTGWANFLVPMAFGHVLGEGIFFQNGQYWTSSYYLGMATLWLALLAIWKCRNRRVWLLVIFAAFAVIFALGPNTPIFPAVRKIFPQFGFITYPVKYLLLVAFIAPLLAAFSLARLREQNLQKQIFVVGIFLFLLTAVVTHWVGKLPHPLLSNFDVRPAEAAHANGLSRLGFLILTGVILLALTHIFGERTRPCRKYLWWGEPHKIFAFAPLFLILIAWLDVLTHEPAQNPTVPPSVYQADLAREKLKMNPQPALGVSRARVSRQAFMEFIALALLDPRENYLAKRAGYCGDCNLLDAVPKVDGFFSLTPRENNDLISLIYGSTNDFPRLDDFLGVSQITAPDEMYHWLPRRTFLPLVTAGQMPVYLNDPETLWALAQSNFDGGKMVFLPPATKPLVAVTTRTAARVLSSKFETQSVEIRVAAAATSLVVIAQTYYHDWRAFVDGRPVPIFRANDAFQAIQVPQGTHDIQLIYQDRAFEIGAALSLIAWVVCVCGLFKSSFR